MTIDPTDAPVPDTAASAPVPAAVAPAAPAPAAPIVGPGSATPGYPAAGWPAPAGPGGYPPPPPTSSSAIVALVLAISAWVVCPVIPAVVALVFASRATREIRGSGGALRGSELTLAAKLVAWINIGFFLLVLLILGSIGVVVFLASMAGVSQTT